MGVFCVDGVGRVSGDCPANVGRDFRVGHARNHRVAEGMEALAPGPPALALLRLPKRDDNTGGFHDCGELIRETPGAARLLPVEARKQGGLANTMRQLPQRRHGLVV